MPYVSVDTLKYYSFDLLQDLPVHQAVFTRRGGVSPTPWESLNVGGTNGDERGRVIENRRRMFAAFGRRVDSLFDVWQVHGDVAIASDRPRPLEAPHQEADIILTDQPEITLFMRFGDCVPIFLVDPVRKAICIAHAGWQGTVQKVASAAVKAMYEHYGSLPKHIHAGIGPSVGVHHYEVGENVIQAAEKAFGQDAPELLPCLNGKTHFDLWKANEITLKQAGVQHIQISGVCTVCHIDDWFSHRGEHGNTGRFGALLALKNGSKKD